MVQSRDPWRSSSFLLNHALLQGHKEAISRTEADCRVRAAGIRPGQDDWYALICLQINDSDKNSHRRKPRKETRGVEGCCCNKGFDSKSLRTGWSHRWLYA